MNLLGFLMRKVTEAGEMFQFLTAITRHELALRQVPAFTLSFLVASLFYKFGSFALECLAFLITWFVVDATVQILMAVLDKTAERGGALAPDK